MGVDVGDGVVRQQLLLPGEMLRNARVQAPQIVARPAGAEGVHGLDALLVVVVDGGQVQLHALAPLDPLAGGSGLLDALALAQLVATGAAVHATHGNVPRWSIIPAIRVSVQVGEQIRSGGGGDGHRVRRPRA